MKRPTTLVREIESIRTKITLLRDEQARIGEEISVLIATNKTKMMELVGATVERWDLSQVPVQSLLLTLSKLSEDIVHDRSNFADAANIQAFVRFGRNASASNRQRLEAAGLHWNGREGEWLGNVTEAQLAELRRAFGARVEKPARPCGRWGRVSRRRSGPAFRRREGYRCIGRGRATTS